MKKMFSVFTALLALFTLGSVPASAEGAASVSAAAAVIMNADTGEVIFQKNAAQKLSMASTTKIMTALILAEQPDLSKTVQVTRRMVTVEGSSMGLLEGDTVSYHDLLYGMLLASGNDAANTTAYALAGSVEAFVRMMNRKAKALGMQNTSFVTPSGLDDENHYSTAYDMAILAAAALTNDCFRAACSSSTATLYYGNPPYRRTLKNHNRLLDSYEGMIGVKTGFTKKSGRCLVTAAERDGVRVIAVTLNDPNDWDDHRRMLDYGFEACCAVSFDNADIANTVPVICGDCDLVRLQTEPVRFGVTKAAASKITRRIELPRFIYSTVAAGEKVGSVGFYLENRLICSADILSAADVKRCNPKDKLSKRFWNSIRQLMNSI